MDARDLLRSDSQTSVKDVNPLKAGSLTDIESVKRPKGRPAKNDFVSKRPEGVPREVYNLLRTGEGKDMASIMPTETKKIYRNPKAQMGLRAVRRYKWVPFNNEARSDGLQLFHWQRVDRLENPAPYPFARFNKVINVPTYTDAEYKEHLQCAKWTKEETDYLFEICRRFDLRWPVVVDRYDPPIKAKERRTMEDLKERFYSVVSEMNLLKNPGCEPVLYDAEHEKRRKEQLRKQWDRTAEELEEEEQLQNELKKIEARKRERERKAQDLQKLINMEQLSPSVNAAMSPSLGKKKFRNKIGSVVAATLAAPSISTEIPSTTLRFSEFRSAGAHLRSQEMKLPTNIGQKKLKTIETIIDKLKLEMNPMGAEEIVSAYNEFRSNVVLLQELKMALQAAEFDLESLRTKLVNQTGQTFEIEPKMRISALPEGGHDDVFLDQGGAPTTRRRIASYIELNPPSALISNRKRKMPLPPTAMDLKRTRKS